MENQPIETFDEALAIKAQKDYATAKQHPHFAPADGKCYKCKKPIYEQSEDAGGFKRGISVEKAGSTLITGCPHCNRSYCD